jgi:hypothetical protein
MAKQYGDRWKVVGDICEGGQGVVYRVTDITRELPGEWALKRGATGPRRPAGRTRSGVVSSRIAYISRP